MSLLNVLDWSRKKDNIPLIFAGSASRYGNVYDNPYAFSKFSLEQLSPEKSLGMRFTTTYGPNAREQMLIPKILKDDVIDFIDESRKKFRNLPPEDIAFPRTASNVQKYKASSTIYAKGTPIHIRGSLLFNHYVKQKKLNNKYSLIGNGEKVKFLYLKKPNLIQENVLSFIQDFPHELGLDKYIDYDLQFEKSFVEPLKTILDAIGWNVEKTVNLELFFT